MSPSICILLLFLLLCQIPVINFRDKTRRVRLFHLGYKRGVIEVGRGCLLQVIQS